MDAVSVVVLGACAFAGTLIYTGLLRPVIARAAEAGSGIAQRILGW